MKVLQMSSRVTSSVTCDCGTSRLPLLQLSLLGDRWYYTPVLRSHHQYHIFLPLATASALTLLSSPAVEEHLHGQRSVSALPMAEATSCPRPALSLLSQSTLNCRVSSSRKRKFVEDVVHDPYLQPFTTKVS